MVVGLGAVAAAVALAFAIPQFGRLAQRDDTDNPLSEAERLAKERETGSNVDSSRARVLRNGTKRKAVEHPVEREVEPEPEPAPEPEPKAAGLTEPAKARQQHRSTLDELEAEAQAYWEDGDLRRAEAGLRAVIRRAGRSRRAELAYADLFAVIEQRGGRKPQTRVWREYTRKFPHGRFSDDIRAGLCRRASAREQDKCWRRYVDDYSTGAHTSEARRVLSGALEKP